MSGGAAGAAPAAVGHEGIGAAWMPREGRVAVMLDGQVLSISREEASLWRAVLETKVGVGARQRDARACVKSIVERSASASCIARELYRWAATVTNAAVAALHDALRVALAIGAGEHPAQVGA